MRAERGSRVRYKEGDFFAVSLRGGGYATGLVARAGTAGKVLLGYFFGPLRSEPASLDEVRRYRPSDAVLVAHFGDLSLQGGEWPIIGQAETWQREVWPMPVFGRVDEAGGRAWRVEYADDDPNEIVRELPCSPEEAIQLPRDSMLGAGAVEIRLTKYLSPPH